MGIQSFMMKAMLKSKMKGVPEAQIDQLVAMIEKNPDFFQKIAEEIKKRVASGQNETAAAMQVMREHQAELQAMQK